MNAIRRKVNLRIRVYRDRKLFNTIVLFSSILCLERQFELSSLILSSEFWPPFKSDTLALELPAEIKENFDRFTRSYEAHKGNRTLNWRPVIGSVEIEVETKDKTLNLNVPPVQAVIIHQFQAQGK